MAQRYDLVTPREDKNGKTWWTRVGVAFENQNGDGFSLSFEALPLPSLDRDGKLQVRVLMRAPRERDDDRSASQPATRKASAPTKRESLLDDDGEPLPF
jgi:hypothetical protein